MTYRNIFFLYGAMDLGSKKLDGYRFNGDLMGFDIDGINPLVNVYITLENPAFQS